MWIPYIVETLMEISYNSSFNSGSKSYSIFFYYYQLINTTVIQNKFQLKKISLVQNTTNKRQIFPDLPQIIVYND